MGTPKVDPDRVAALLAQWELAKSSGQKPRLEDICPCDGPLRDELRSRIESLEKLREFLIVDEEISTPFSLPHSIGKYEVQEVIASTGMGIVCRCTQPAPYRDVAVKLLQPLQAAGVALERFRLEAHILGLMQHSGIAQIYEAGITSVLDNPIPFIAMEYIDGSPLGKYAIDKQLATKSKLELVLAVCEAMGHAHRQGVIHRDLKPANVLVTQEGHVKIVDFGIARITDAALRQSLIKHDTVGIVGSLAYTSPEQIRGETDHLDERADVYSIGIIMYELLTGSLPFPIYSQNYLELIRQISLDPPPALGTLDREFKGDLESIVAKAIEKSPQDRYLSCDHLAADLRRFLRGMPVRARRVNTFVKTWRWMKRNVEVAVLLLTIPVILSVSLFFVSLFAYKMSQALKSEEAAFRHAMRLKFKSDQGEVRANRLAAVAQNQTLELRRQAFNATLNEVQRLKRSAALIARSLLLDEGECPPEYRSLAWQILLKRHSREPLTWEAGGQVFDVAYSRGAALVASTGEHGQVRFWETQTGKMLTARRGTLKRQRILSIDPEGELLVTATDHRDVRVWNCHDLSLVSEFKLHEQSITATAISAGGDQVASADEAGLVYAWDSPQSENVQELSTLGSKLVSLRHAKDGELVGIDVAGNIIRWNLMTGKRIQVLPLNMELTHALISPQNQFVIASVGRNHHIDVFRLDDGERLKTIPLAGRNHGVYSISDDESLVAVASGRRIDMWSTDPWEQVNRLSGHEERVVALSFGPGAHQIVSAGGEEQIKIQDTFREADQWESLPVASTVQDIQVIPGKQQYLVAVAGGGLLMDFQGRQVLETLHCKPTISTNLSVAPEGDTVAIQYADRRINIFRLGDKDSELLSPVFRSKIREIMFSRESDGLFATTRDGPLEYWCLTEKEPICIWPEYTTHSLALAQHPESNVLYVGMHEGTILYGDPHASEPQELIVKSDGRLTDLTISPDGKRLATSDRNGSIQLWDLEHHRPLAQLKRHTDYVHQVEFTPDSKTLLSAGRDGYVILWDAINGDYQLSLDCPAQNVVSLCVSEDGRGIALGTTENRIWTLWAE